MIQLALTMAAALLQLPCNSATAIARTATLTVEVVDQNWLPFPGAEVIVTTQDRRRESWRAVTGAGGAAPFDVTRPSTYTIEVRIAGFKTRRLKDVTIGVVTGESPGARVQVRLALSGPAITVY